MQDEHTVLDLIEKAKARRDARRSFLRTAGGAAAMAGGLSLLAACGDDDNDPPVVVPTPTPTPTAGTVSEADVLNFALNLEYLEASFYSYAAFGTGLASNLMTGTGAQGAVATGTSGQPRGVQFTDATVAQYAREIAYDEINHVRFLRSALGSSAAAMPAINISGDASGAFTAAARAAQVIGQNDTFDPYASDNNFLLAAYLFEDVGVTAYMGGVQLLSTPATIEAAAGIHAVEAYHAGLVRTLLYSRGVTTSSLVTAAGQISAARDTLDGTANTGLLGQGGSRDQGIAATTVNGQLQSNIVPADSNGIAFVRSPQQVLNIVYLNPNASTTSGGFFPAGVNGTVRST
ncbi:ferritin-like domain-containing protein [Sphingomonas abaci]|uniref:Ferritin-like domain-containing protein n=1 Tax=Sphingomonas abaci TaxID=237611 RepID=A0A7W7AIW4_9SPHN|nr:ferritin-like domain-containing protein [Sphingomonas abaci]MBB4616857.1 hypothetical protein [Sphingomonas abaci]